MKRTAFVVLCSLLAGGVSAAAEGTGSELPRISRSDLAAAVEKGEPIVGRLIDGKDVEALLTAHFTTGETCARHAALRIESSKIRGEINLESNLVPNEPAKGGTKKSAEEQENADTSNDVHPEKWLSIPWSVTDTTIEDAVTLKNVGTACDLDWSRSSFAGPLRLVSPTLNGQMIGEGTTFKSGLEAQRANFKNAVVFRRATFSKNFESVLGDFEGDVDFRDAVFSRLASFIQNRFMRHMDFRYVQFAMGANFSNAVLGAQPSGTFSGPFYMAEFGGPGNFRRARFKQLRFLRSLLRNGVDLTASKGDSLWFLGVTISGPFTMDTAQVKTVQLDGWGGSMVVDGDATFRQARIDSLTLRQMAFKKTVDFQALSVKTKIDVSTVSFEGDLHFEDGLLPGTQDDAGAGSGANDDDDDGTQAKPAAKDKPDNTPPPQTRFVGITLAKGLYIDRDQFFERRPGWAFWREESPRLFPDDPEKKKDESDLRNERVAWRQLDRAFESAKNTELKNYAEYRISRSEEESATGFQKAVLLTSRLFWGYGVRPVRALAWLAILVFGFALIYSLQLSQLAMTRLERIRSAVIFSARTAWELKYGYDNSRTTAFRVITLFESAMAKLILALFAYALTQTNPLLSELTKKLLP